MSTDGVDGIPPYGKWARALLLASPILRVGDLTSALRGAFKLGRYRGKREGAATFGGLMGMAHAIAEQQRDKAIEARRTWGLATLRCGRDDCAICGST